MHFFFSKYTFTYLINESAILSIDMLIEVFNYYVTNTYICLCFISGKTSKGKYFTRKSLHNLDLPILQLVSFYFFDSSNYT